MTTHWDVSGPQTIELGEVTALHLRIVAGDASVTATDGPARLEVHSIEGAPLLVDLKDGTLTITYEDLSWGGILDWIMGGRAHRREVSLALAVPADCEVHLGTVSATAVVSGVTKPTTVRSVSGDVTLDGIGGEVSAKTVSGHVEALALAGDLRFDTVSGDLTVGSGRGRTVKAKTVSGDITLAIELEPGGEIDLATVSGDAIIRLPAEVGAKVFVQTVGGRLTSAYDGLTSDKSPGRRRLEGAIGDGSGSIRIKTVSGDVDLVVCR